MHLVVKPGGAVAGEHVHRAMSERFTVVSGRLQTRIAGRHGQLGPGEATLAATGTPHDCCNAGDVPASVIVELSHVDGLARFEAMIATLWGLANTGQTNAKGLPSPLQLALTASEFSDIVRMTRPPASIQSAGVAVFGAVARRRGLRPTYPELLRPHGSVDPDPEILTAAGLA